MAVRHAEKSRRATAPFADLLAIKCLEAFEKALPEALRGAYSQTVVAAIVLQGPLESDLEVIALGVGTKVLPLELAILGTFPSERIKDMHAEVLARRGFIQWLYDQLEKGEKSPYLVPVCKEEQRHKLRSEYSLHLYTSSQPCGNACVKAWAKSKQPQELALGAYCCPTILSKHPRFHVTAEKEGQISALVKRSSREDSCWKEEEGIYGVDATLRRSPPPGTSYCDVDKPAFGYSMTCSDKICRWSCLGLQGALLARFLEPIYLQSITVGRKFSQVHCERALCCRASHFSSACGLYAVHHPAMLCCSVKFDNSTIVTGVAIDTKLNESMGVGADFSDKRCFVWHQRGKGEILDGASGFSVFCKDPPSSQSSYYSAASVFRRYNALCIMRGLEPEIDYRAAKRSTAEYVYAKDKLFSPPFFFAEFHTYSRAHFLN